MSITKKLKDFIAPDDEIFELSDEDLKAKTKAMSCYEFESRIFPHPRSSEALEALAKYRGIQVGCHYAEAFQIIRHIM